MKRKISFLLALIMLVSMFTGIVSAARVDDIPAGTIADGKSLSAAKLNWPVAEFTVQQDTNLSASMHGAWVGAGSNISYDSAEGKTAAGSIKFGDITSGNNYLTFCAKQGALQKGKTYVLSAWVKSSIANQSVCLRVSSSSVYDDKWCPIEVANEWQCIAMQFTTSIDEPPNGYEAIIFSGAISGAIWIDDIMIAEVIDEPTDLLTLDENKGLGFVELKDTDDDGYTAFYRPAALEAGKTYSVSVRLMTSYKDATISIDNGTGGENRGFGLDANDEWKTVEYDLTPAAAVTNLRIYTTALAGQVLIKDWVVKEKDTGNIVLDFNGKTTPTDVVYTYRVDAEVHPVPLSNLPDLDANKDGGYVLLTPQANGGSPYGMVYLEGDFKKGETYTVCADIMTNNLGVNIWIDNETDGNSTRAEVSPSAVDVYESISEDVTINNDCTSLRIYAHGSKSQIAVKDIYVYDSNGEIVSRLCTRTAPVNEAFSYRDNYTHYPVTALTDLTGMDENAEGAYVLLEPATTNSGYGAYYHYLPLEVGKTYVVGVGIMSNNVNLPVYFDLEGQGGVDAVDVTPYEADTPYYSYFAITPTSAASSEDGYPARIYVNSDNIDGQVIVGGLVVVDEDENYIAHQNFESMSVPTLTRLANNEGETVATYVAPKVNIAYSDLKKLDENKDGGYILLSPSGAGEDTQYGAVYLGGEFKKGETYTITAKAMVNKTQLKVMTDIEGTACKEKVFTNLVFKDSWTDVTATVTPTSKDGDSIRIYVNQTDGAVGQVALKDIEVRDSKGNLVAKYETYFEATKDGNPRVAGKAEWIAPEGGVKKSDLFEQKGITEKDYVYFAPTKDSGYAAYYVYSKLNKNETYTVTFDAISNTPNVKIMCDLEDGAALDRPSSAYVIERDKWGSYSLQITPKLDWKANSAKTIAENGWPFRLYVTQSSDAQIFIDNLVVKDSKGNVVFSQDFKTSKVEGTVAEVRGNATHIPVGYVPYKEGEVLGFNELINGDFEDASLMNYWWMRNDWNGGTWAVEEENGYKGSKGLVARGTGKGTSDQNAGCYYSLYGEGHEATLDLTPGKTYVLTYKVFRPAGVDAPARMDIFDANDGGVVSASATKNGEWETVTARFVAPEGALKIRLLVNALAEGEYVCFDEIELRQVGGDPNGNPKTDDNMNLGFVVAVMAISVAGVVIVSKKRVLSK